MDCPTCGQGFSIAVGAIHHGKQVGRTRHCPGCRAEWVTVEVTKTQHEEMVKALVRDIGHTCRAQFKAIVEGDNVGL